jgi:hypothetical protein
MRPGLSGLGQPADLAGAAATLVCVQRSVQGTEPVRILTGAGVSHLPAGVHLGDMRTMRWIGYLALGSLTMLACKSETTFLNGRDGAAGQGAGGAGTGGAAGRPGTGGSNESGGIGGAASGGASGTGFGGDDTALGGRGGGGLRGSGGSGTGGAVKDGGQPDAASDVLVSADSPVSGDVDPGCGPGYPLNSQRPQGDGCNTCYCEGGGYWLCTTKACPPPADAAPEVGGDAGPCPAGQVYCPGCPPNPGTCGPAGTVCTGPPCPVNDAGCTGSGCSTADAASTAKDASNAESGSATCAQVTTQAECDVRADCHSVFVDLMTCGCAASGCCTRFNRCADGGRAACNPPVAFGCTIVTPYCESPYVVSYTSNCYEGCVKSTECAE